MTHLKNPSALIAAICTLGLLLGAPAAARAQSSNALTTTEVEAMGHLVVKAAHFTGQNPRLVRYQTHQTKSNRVTYTLTMEYYGKWTGSRYLATVDVHFETSGYMEAMRVDYSDNNCIWASASKVARSVHQINNLLGNP